MSDAVSRPAMRRRNLLVGFVAGVLAVAIFHQLAVLTLGLVGLGEGVFYSFRPTAPLGVPRVMSQMFWGGVWGIVFALVVDHAPKRWPLVAVGAAFGILGPSLFGWLVLAPLRGDAAMAGFNPRRLAASALVNGTFGVGLAILFARLRDFAHGKTR